ncbi:MAG: alpha/beta fold hydrolase [Xanthobacteraceae bacterium]
MAGNPLAIAIVLSVWVWPAVAQERVGIVLMHGKQSAPTEHLELTGALAAAGFLTDVPEMCWSGRRIYDRPYRECLREIDAAIRRLKQKRATAVVVIGHSLGANGALGYGAATKGLKGIVALAPGHRPEALSRRAEVIASLARARKLAALGRGDIPDKFIDFNGSLAVTVVATPNAYLSFFAPDSPSLMPINAARLQAPLLYVVGTGDPLQRGPNEIFAKAKHHPLNRYVTVDAGHFDTSAAAAPAVVAWLKELAQN